MMEIYTVELEMCYSLGDSVTLKSIHKKIIDIQSTMNETGTNAIIHETAGKIYMSEQKY
jgi:Mlc titration factor MtfA (ptsG expression regulator)